MKKHHELETLKRKNKGLPSNKLAEKSCDGPPTLDKKSANSFDLNKTVRQLSDKTEQVP